MMQTILIIEGDAALGSGLIIPMFHEPNMPAAGFR